MEIFISYEREDGVSEFAQHLFNLMEKASLNPWMDVKSIGPGKDWIKEIGQAIQRCDAFVAVISKKYVAESNYCEKELCVANQRGKKVFPVLYHDFTEWKDLPNGQGVNLMISNVNWCMYCTEGEDSLAALIQGIKSTLQSTVNDSGMPNASGEAVTKQGSSSSSSEIFKSKPTMSMLMTMVARNGKKLDIVLTLSQDWQQVGDLLDFDDLGVTVSNIHMTRSLQGNVACLKEVLQLWLAGKGRNSRYMPPTWGNFISLLMDLRHTTLASDLRCFFKGTRPHNNKF